MKITYDELLDTLESAQNVNLGDGEPLTLHRLECIEAVLGDLLEKLKAENAEKNKKAAKEAESICQRT
jgi:hypothetical protein